MGFPGGEESACKWETLVPFLGLEDLLEKGMATHYIFLSGDFHGQGSKESDTTEVTEHTHADSFTDVEDRIKFLPTGKESKEQSTRTPRLEENGLNHSFPVTL